MNRYAESQFPLYNNLWASLSDLKDTGALLWENASVRNLHLFAKQLQETLQTVNRSALLLEEKDYQQLSRLLQTFARFRVGKQKLIELRAEREFYADRDEQADGNIVITIHENKIIKNEFDHLVDALRKPFRDQVSGQRQIA